MLENVAPEIEFVTNGTDCQNGPSTGESEYIYRKFGQLSQR